VTTSQPYLVSGGGRFRIVAYDLGIKRTILRQLAALGTVEVVPASTAAVDVLARVPDGVFLSNGPGDPAEVPYVADAVAGLLGQVPVFGTCPATRSWVMPSARDCEAPSGTTAAPLAAPGLGRSRSRARTTTSPWPRTPSVTGPRSPT
jgi:hypothetical protein